MAEGGKYVKQFLNINIINLFLLIFFAGCASFPHINSGSVGVKTDDVQVKVAFGDSDRRAIYDYYSKKKTKHKSLPPGLAKKGKLPPGLQKQVQRNGKLPPGLAKRHLPYELERQLSPLPRGYVRLKVGGDIVLMNEKTEVVVDIIYDIG
jgi:hypothetical protein